MNRIFQKIKLGLSTLLITLFGLSLLSFTSASALTPIVGAVAPDPTFKSQACTGLTQLNNTQDCASKGSGFSDVVNVVVRILSWVVGVVSIIMIIVSGLKYITSGGDSNKVGSAKTTLIYAIIGLAIAGLAQVLVHFVLSSADTAATPCPGKPAISITDPTCKN